MAERVCICGHNDLLHQAQAERDAQESRGDAYLAEIKKLEAELTQCAVDYREECDKRDAAEASLAKAFEGLSRIKEAAEMDNLGGGNAWVLDTTTSILAEIEESE